MVEGNEKEQRKEGKKKIEIIFDSMNDYNQKMNSQLSVVENVVVENGVVEEYGGSWNESGLVASLDRCGFTPTQCILELLSNVIDARARNALVKIGADIRLIDDGVGMVMKVLKTMFEMFRANHTGEKTMGVSGIGGKEAYYILSKKGKTPSTTLVYTRTIDGEYLKAIMPWDVIISKKIYTGKIRFEQMSHEEIGLFCHERRDFGVEHGTTIRFQYSDELKNLIHSLFDKDIKNTNKFKLTDRPEFVFGKFSTAISLDKGDRLPPIVLLKYNYFGDDDRKYYIGKKVEEIRHYIDDDDKNRFVFEDTSGKTWEFKMNVKCATKESQVNIGETWVLAETLTLSNALRKDDRIMNPSDPKSFDTAETFLNSYDSNFLNEKDAEYAKQLLAGCSLNRNNQLIGIFELEGFNTRTSRGSGEAMLKCFHHRTQLSYDPVSNQDNPTDIVMGIQGNKNQYSQTVHPSLGRLIAWRKKVHLEEINQYFQQLIDTKKEEQRKKFLEQKKKFEEEQRKKFEEEQRRKLEEDQKKKLEEDQKKKLEEEDDDDEEDDEEEEDDDDEENDEDDDEEEDDEEENDEDDDEEEDDEEEDDEEEDDEEDDEEEDDDDDIKDEDFHDTIIPAPQSVVLHATPEETTKESIEELKTRLIEKEIKRIIEKINSETSYEKLYMRLKEFDNE
jgi:Histidine kinase-, DNA gyrase B-, and HSP90-like ATPase